MSQKELKEFARIIVREVRDMAIESCDSQLESDSKTLIAKRWQKAAKAAKGHLPPGEIVPDCVDAAIFYLLDAIDNGTLLLRFVSKSGKVVDLTEEGKGELAGWYMGSGGWRAMSKQRYIDDFADLELDDPT